MTVKTDIYEQVTAQIIAKLEEGVVPWHQPWSGAASMPKSMSTGKTYSGINLWVLGAQFLPSPWWGTYRQIAALGGQVRKGETGTSIMLFRPLPCKEHKSDKCKLCKRAAVARGFVVFNAEQADNLDAKFYGAPTDARTHEPLEVAEQIVSRYLDNSGPKLTLGGNRACYAHASDEVWMPTPEQFENGEEYYSTMFHELTHSTGAKSRLDREGIVGRHSFGDESYSVEELTAEMGAAFLSAVAGIEQTTVPASAAYIAHWLTALRGDKKLLTDAAAAAQRAVTLISQTGAEVADEATAAA